MVFTKEIVHRLHQRIAVLERALEHRDTVPLDLDVNSPDSDYDELNADDFLLYNDVANVDQLDWCENDDGAASPEAAHDGTVEPGALVDGMGALSLGDKIPGRTFYGISSSHGILRFLKSSDNSHYPSSNPIYNKNNIDLLNSNNSDLVLDNHTFRDDFIAAYFDIYHTCFPFISKTAFFDDLRHRPEPLDRHSIRAISFQVLLNTVLAIGALCKLGESTIIDLLYYKRVKKCLRQLDIVECGSFQLLEAFVLLGNYTQKRNKPNTSWNYHGLSLRMAITFGLHKEINVIDRKNSRPLQELEVLERRRRLWWGLFYFDVGHSVTFGRPLHLPMLESIDIKYPLNIDDDDDIESTKAPNDLAKQYPTIYSGLIQEARFSKLSYKIYNTITNVSRNRSDTLSVKMHRAIELNNLVVDFTKSLPAYFDEDDATANANVSEICPTSWFQINLSGQKSVPRWFLLARLKLIWRYKNLQILLFRRLIWESTTSVVDAPELLEECLDSCYRAANESIISVTTFIEEHDIDTVLSWYATYFLFQAVLIPVLLLFRVSQTSQPQAPRTDQWINDIEMTKEGLLKLRKYNTLAGNLVETLNIITNPFLESLRNSTAEDPSVSHNITIFNLSPETILLDDKPPETAKGTGPQESLNGYEFKDISSATINLFSNVGVDFEPVNTNYDLNEARSDFKRATASNDGSSIDNYLSSLFPNDVTKTGDLDLFLISEEEPQPLSEQHFADVGQFLNPSEEASLFEG